MSNTIFDDNNGDRTSRDSASFFVKYRVGSPTASSDAHIANSSDKNNKKVFNFN